MPELDNWSFQLWLVRQPVKLGGIVLRSLADTSAVAFIGSVEMAVPHLTSSGGEEAICPQLEEVIGSVEGPQQW